MIGTAQDDFSTKYGRDVRCVPGFNVEANCYDVYLPDTPMYRNAVEKHKEYDACTPHMLGLEHDPENCPQCGAEPQYQKFHGKVEDSLKEIFIQKDVDGNCENLLN